METAAIYTHDTLMTINKMAVVRIGFKQGIINSASSQFKYMGWDK